MWGNFDLGKLGDLAQEALSKATADVEKSIDTTLGIAKGPGASSAAGQSASAQGHAAAGSKDAPVDAQAGTGDAPGPAPGAKPKKIVKKVIRRVVKGSGEAAAAGAAATAPGAESAAPAGTTQTPATPADSTTAPAGDAVPSTGAAAGTDLEPAASSGIPEDAEEGTRASAGPSSQRESRRASANGMGAAPQKDSPAEALDGTATPLEPAPPQAEPQTAPEHAPSGDGWDGWPDESAGGGAPAPAPPVPPAHNADADAHADASTASSAHGALADDSGAPAEPSSAPGHPSGLPSGKERKGKGASAAATPSVSNGRPSSGAGMATPPSGHGSGGGAITAGAAGTTGSSGGAGAGAGGAGAEDLGSADPEELRRLVARLRSDLSERDSQLAKQGHTLADLQQVVSGLQSRNEQLALKSAQLSEADFETVRGEFEQRLAAAERKVYALTKERDALRKGAEKLADYSALIKEKDDIIKQVMDEGEKLSKKQVEMEGIIKRLRGQLGATEGERDRAQQRLAAEEAAAAELRRAKAKLEKDLVAAGEQAKSDLESQKEHFELLLQKAKSDQVDAEERARDAAAQGLARRLREAEARCEALTESCAELRDALDRQRQAADLREEMLKADLSDLERRCQGAELRHQDLAAKLPETTRPLLRQIEAMQAAAEAQTEAWAGAEAALHARISDAEGRAASAGERERLAVEKMQMLLSKVSGLEASLSAARAEVRSLSSQLEEARGAAAAAREASSGAVHTAEVLTERCRAQQSQIEQLEASLSEARESDRLLRTAAEHETSGLRREYERRLAEAEAELEELRAQLESSNRGPEPPTMAAPGYRWQLIKESEAAPAGGLTHHHSDTQLSASASHAHPHWSTDGSHASSHHHHGGGLGSRPSTSSADILSGAMRGGGHGHGTAHGHGHGTADAVHTVMASDLESLRAQLRAKTGELAALQQHVTELEATRDRLAEELVAGSARTEAAAEVLAARERLEAEAAELRARLANALELVGERDEQVEELLADLQDVKSMYKDQIEFMVQQLAELQGGRGIGGGLGAVGGGHGLGHGHSAAGQAGGVMAPGRPPVPLGAGEPGHGHGMGSGAGSAAALGGLGMGGGAVPPGSGSPGEPGLRAPFPTAAQVVAGARASAASSGSWWHYPPDSYLVMQSGSGNNWAQGFHGYGPKVAEAAAELVRKEVEHADSLTGFLLLQSMAGGTGAGLGTYVAQALRDDYHSAFVTNCCVWPYESGEVIVQPYNTLFTLSHLSDVSDGIVLLENEALHRTAARLLNIARPSFADMNGIAARALASVLLPAQPRGPHAGGAHAASGGSAAGGGHGRSSPGSGGGGGGGGAGVAAGGGHLPALRRTGSSGARLGGEAAPLGYSPTAPPRLPPDAAYPGASSSRPGSGAGSGSGSGPGGPAPLSHAPLAELLSHLCGHPCYRMLTLRAVPQLPPSSIDFTTFTWPAILKRLRQMLVTGSVLEEGMDWSLTPASPGSVPGAEGVPLVNKAIANWLVLRGQGAGEVDVSDFAEPGLTASWAVDPLSVSYSPAKFGRCLMSGSLLSNDRRCVGPIQRMQDRAYDMLASRAFVHQYEAYGTGVADFECCFARVEDIASRYARLR
ncbi:hypothetical protein HYH03_011914 [Edaphochlamys debaryana]|uniref:Tubulin delta chain n=1 Tax=Edaphochlamys debaryana TaxID=47281 RepID=A0A835XZ98_9CHLO|nr:hypothetical protein HYH03_011914 [Edaphochlamys debaryana]|eukprot:KAG2489635.1 hypothetical protein HYH03_011914 [Edaphochlamys debaryana]